jgi:hypothetical protein
MENNWKWVKFLQELSANHANFCPQLSIQHAEDNHMLDL